MVSGVVVRKKVDENQQGIVHLPTVTQRLELNSDHKVSKQPNPYKTVHPLVPYGTHFIELSHISWNPFSSQLWQILMNSDDYRAFSNVIGRFDFLTCVWKYSDLSENQSGNWHETWFHEQLLHKSRKNRKYVNLFIIFLNFFEWV